jgi:hypothetical protein
VAQGIIDRDDSLMIVQLSDVMRLLHSIV